MEHALRIDTPLPGCYELQFTQRVDLRGEFVKTVHAPTFAALGLTSSFRETYYSISHAGVLRGMHLQLPPHDHTKLVYCVSGRVLDVAVDLRQGPTYGHFHSVELSAANAKALYLPRGCAHGFLSLEPSTLMYHVTTEYAYTHDTGIRWDSFGFAWPLASQATPPIVSPRDAALPTLADFKSPFVGAK